MFLPIDRATGKPRGFAFIQFSDPAAVPVAIQKLDGADLQGRTIRVSEARDRAPRPAFSPDDGPFGGFGARPGKSAKPKGSRRNIRGRKRGF